LCLIDQHVVERTGAALCGVEIEVCRGDCCRFGEVDASGGTCA
jgi:hypothetical protein